MRLFFLFFLLCSAVVNAQDSISVLFIGNSYTYVNDLPIMVRDFAASKGKTITVASKANGGFTFANHASDAATYTAIQTQPWDVVVLQAQSQEPSFPYDQVTTSTLPYAVQLNDSILANNACGNTLFFMTWGREVGDPQWDSINTFDKMNARLYDAYMRFATETDAMVSPVGAVWKYVRDHYPTIQLYSGDGSHPSLAGSYLAASTFYTALFLESPVGASYTAGLDQTTVDQLQLSVQTVMMDSLDHFYLHSVNEPTQAHFDVTQTNEQVDVQSTTFNATSWQWSFGDGTVASTQQASHTYTASGTYSIQLIVGSACNSDTLVQTVVVENLGIPSIEMDDFWSVTNGNLVYQAVESGGKIGVYSFQGQLLSEFSFESKESVLIPETTQPVLIKIVFTNGQQSVYRYMKLAD